MLLATVVFWSGRWQYAHVPPHGVQVVRAQLLSREGLRVVGRLSSIYIFVAMFWALYDQTGAAWVQQARRMDRNFLCIEWLPSQAHAAGPRPPARDAAVLLLACRFRPAFTVG